MCSACSRCAGPDSRLPLTLPPPPLLFLPPSGTSSGESLPFTFTISRKAAAQFCKPHHLSFEQHSAKNPIEPAGPTDFGLIWQSTWHSRRQSSKGSLVLVGRKARALKSTHVAAGDLRLPSSMCPAIWPSPIFPFLDFAPTVNMLTFLRAAAGCIHVQLFLVLQGILAYLLALKAHIRRCPPAHQTAVMNGRGMALNPHVYSYAPDFKNIFCRQSQNLPLSISSDHTCRRRRPGRQRPQLRLLLAGAAWHGRRVCRWQLQCVWRRRRGRPRDG